LSLGGWRFAQQTPAIPGFASQNTGHPFDFAILLQVGPFRLKGCESGGIVNFGYFSVLARRVNRVFRSPWNLLLAGMALVCVSAAGGAAQASCGDYLASHTTAHSPMANDLQQSPLPAGPRCNGPACRRAPAKPPAMPPVEIVVVDKCALAAVALDGVNCEPSQQFASPQNDHLLPDDHYPSLKRPPRTIA